MLLEKSLQALVFVGMSVYIAFVILIGVYYAKKNKSTEDFFLGSRSLGPWMTALSAEASDMSSWLLMGLPGLAYLTGLANAFYTALGLLLGTYANWYLVSRRLRIYSHECNNSITIPDYFSNRFNDDKKILTIISSIIIFVFFVVYTSSGFAALGKLFESLFGFDYLTMMIIGGTIVVLYTMLGGFLAESASDFVQAILMVFSLIVIVIVGVIEAGGSKTLFTTWSNHSNYISLTKTTTKSLSFIDIISTFAWGLGYFGMPHVLLRFMAIEDVNKLKKSRRVAMIWVLISLFAAVLIGLIGSAAIPNLLDNCVNKASRSETIFIAMTTLLSKYGAALSLIVGVILSGIIAATMSTSDSQLLITSSVVSQNLIKSIMGKDYKEKHLMRISRITIIIVAIFASFLARNKDSSVFSIVSYAWAGFGASFGPVILCSLFWKRTNLTGAVSGMIGGFVSVVVWKHFLADLGGVFLIYELLPSFIIGLICIIIGSLISKKPDQKSYELFEKVRLASKERG